MSAGEKKAIYVFLRKDLGQVQRAVQAGHVCLEAGRRFPLPDERYRVVILGVRSEAKLRDVMAELSGLGVAHVSFVEPDLGQMTAVATEPLDESRAVALERYRLLEPT